MKFKTAVLKYLNDNKVGKVVYVTKKIETHTTSKDIQEVLMRLALPQQYKNVFFSYLKFISI